MKKSSIKLNLIYNVAYQLLLIVTPLITSPYVSRTLGTDGVGTYSYTYSVANCFALVGMLGVTNYGNRTIAAVQNDRRKRSEAFWSIFSLQALTTIAVLVVYCVFIFTICSSDNRNIFIIQSMVVLCSLCDINWYFFGVEKFKLTVSRNVIIKIANVILIFLLVRNAHDTALYTGIISGSLLVSNLAIWPFLKKEVDFVKPNLKNITKHFSQTLILFIPVIAITLYKRMDKVMLGLLSTMSQTGLYENTEKIINIPNSIIAALGTVMLPRMSYLFANGDEKEAKQYIKVSMEFVCLVASPLMFGVAGVAIEFAPWFFGEEFSDVGLLLMWMAPTILFVSWANVIRTQYLIPLHRDRIYVISVWVGAVINLVINATLIPLYGALGAVIGTVCAEGAVAIFQTIKVKKQLQVSSFVKNGAYYFFAGIVMFCFVRFIGKMGESNLKTIALEVISGGVIYLIVCMPYLIIRHKKEFYSIVAFVWRKLNRGRNK